MYAMGLHPFGYHVLLTGQVGTAEMSRLLEQVRRALARAPRRFGVIWDLRSMVPLAPAARRVLAQAIGLYQRGGMDRSAVVVLTAETKRDFVESARASGLFHWERYLSAEDTPDWLARAQAWVSAGIDPDGCVR